MENVIIFRVTELCWEAAGIKSEVHGITWLVMELLQKAGEQLAGHGTILNQAAERCAPVGIK